MLALNSQNAPPQRRERGLLRILSWFNFRKPGAQASAHDDLPYPLQRQITRTLTPPEVNLSRKKRQWGRIKKGNGGRI